MGRNFKKNKKIEKNIEFKNPINFFIFSYFFCGIIKTKINKTLNENK